MFVADCCGRAICRGLGAVLGNSSTREKMRELTIRIFALLLLVGLSFAQPVNIRLEHGSGGEQRDKGAADADTRNL